MAACCCLCRSPVPADHRRRKKLHGTSCATAKSVLTEVSGVSLETLVETSDPAAVLCYSCERVLNNIHSTAAKLETLKADVKGKVSVLQSVTLCPEKRRRPIPDAELPQAKHTCIENVLPVPAPPSTSDPVPTTTQVTPPTDSQSQLPSTSAAVEPAVQEPSPHIQVYRSLNYCHDK